MTDIDLRQKEFEHKSVMDRERLTMDKIDLLLSALALEKPVRPPYQVSETVYEPALSEDSLDMIENQLIKLIKKIC